MPLYVGLDLHSNNNFMAVMNKQGKRVDHKKLPNDPELTHQVHKKSALYIDKMLKGGLNIG